MIPKKLHYVWIGDGEMPEPDRSFVAGWARMCPGWEIRRWGLDDLKGIDCVFAQETVAAKKWVFTSDWLRLHALSQEGGFYLDTDVELKDSLERFRGDSLCMGLNLSGYPQTALIGAEPHHPIIEELLEQYSRSRFILGEGCYDETANNDKFFRLFKHHGVTLTDLTQDAAHEPLPGVKFYPCSLLCHPIGEQENIAHHHLKGSWLTPFKRKAVYRLPFGLRAIRLKARVRFGGKGDLGMLEDEKILAKAHFGRTVLVLAKKNTTR